MRSHAGKTILVVEDDDNCRDASCSILRSAGFEVSSARNFYEAIAIIERGGRTDIALVDVKMPPGTPHGVSFARMAQLRRPSLKIIFMSANIDAQDFKMLDDGEAFLHKPFAPHQLLSLLERAA